MLASKIEAQKCGFRCCDELIPSFVDIPSPCSTWFIDCFLRVGPAHADNMVEGICLIAEAKEFLPKRISKVSL